MVEVPFQLEFGTNDNESSEMLKVILLLLDLALNENESPL